MDANSNTHGIIICVKKSLKTEVIRVVRLPIAELIKNQVNISNHSEIKR
jgi:hypothetical protein